MENSEKNKKVADLIIEELKRGDLTIFELSHNIGNSEAVIRNTLYRDLKPKGIVSEIGFRKNPNASSTRGYKIYHLHKEKLPERDTEILKKLVIPFAKYNVKAKLKPSDIERVKELLQQQLKEGELSNEQ